MLKATLIDINAQSVIFSIHFESFSARTSRMIMMKLAYLTTSAIIVFTKIFMFATLAIASEKQVSGACTTVTSFLVDTIVTAFVNSQLALIDI